MTKADPIDPFLIKKVNARNIWCFITAWFNLAGQAWRILPYDWGELISPENNSHKHWIMYSKPTFFVIQMLIECWSNLTHPLNKTGGKSALQINT